jgi:hypothetical protein
MLADAVGLRALGRGGPATWSLRPTKHSPRPQRAMPRTRQTKDRSGEQRDVKFSLPIVRIWGRKRLEYYAFLGSEDHRSEIARRAGSSSPRRSHRRPGLQLGPAPDIAHSFFARCGTPSAPAERHSMASDFERTLNDDAGRGRVIAQESFGESYARSLRAGARDFCARSALISASAAICAGNFISGGDPLCAHAGDRQDHLRLKASAYRRLWSFAVMQNSNRLPSLWPGFSAVTMVEGVAAKSESVTWFGSAARSIAMKTLPIRLFFQCRP